MIRGAFYIEDLKMTYKTETNWGWMTGLMTVFYCDNTKALDVANKLQARRHLAAKGEGPRQFLEELGEQLTEFEREVYGEVTDQYLSAARANSWSYGPLDSGTQFALSELRKFAELAGKDIAREVLDIERSGE